MGNICPCNEKNNIYFGELITNKDKKNQNKNLYQIENLNNLKLTNEQKNIFINDKNKIKNSVFTNFKYGNPSLNQYNIFSKRTNLMESLQSKHSDIYFESLSLSNVKNDGSIMIDYYQLSKNIFDLLNEIRINPKESSKEYFSNIAENKLSFDNLKSGDIILWNEKVYLCCSSYLLDVEEKCNINSNKTANERVSERLNNKCNVVEFCVDGLGTSKVILSKLLYENYNRIQLLISDNYLCGAICCFPSKGIKNMRTLVYLVNKE